MSFRDKTAATPSHILPSPKAVSEAPKEEPKSLRKCQIQGALSKQVCIKWISGRLVFERIKIKLKTVAITRTMFKFPENFPTWNLSNLTIADWCEPVQWVTCAAFQLVTSKKYFVNGNQQVRYRNTGETVAKYGGWKIPKKSLKMRR